MIYDEFDAHQRDKEDDWIMNISDDEVASLYVPELTDEQKKRVATLECPTMLERQSCCDDAAWDEWTLKPWDDGRYLTGKTIRSMFSFSDMKSCWKAACKYRDERAGNDI